VTAAAATFDAGLAGWKDWQAAPWGRLYYGVSRANVRRHVGAGPLRILDAGGGNGPDALYFAELGHSVALLDFSAHMLADAQRAAERRGVADCITFHHADCLAIPDLFPDAQFDLVLCHNVLQYVGDVGALLGAVCAPLRPEGLLSLMVVNRYSEPYRAAFREGDLVAAYARLDASTEETPVFGATMRLYTADELVAALKDCGCAMSGQYGVRCLADYLPDDGRKDDPAFFAHLERLEHALAGTYPYYLLARYVHVIARKITGDRAHAQSDADA